MKKTLTLIAALFVAATAFANGFTEAPADTVVTQQQTTQQQTTQQTSQDSQLKFKQSGQQGSFGLYKGMMGTLVSFKGYAPYKAQPEGDKYIGWPRFGVQVGVGYAQSFFTYEGVLEYMQTNSQPVNYDPVYINSLQGSARIGGMLPMQLGNTILLIPSVKAQLGGAFSLTSGYSTYFQAGIIAGLDLGFRLGKKTLTLGFAYEYRWFVNRTTTLPVDFLGGQLTIVL